jgi:LPXTG-motif cell wall-anchored protein
MFMSALKRLFLGSCTLALMILMLSPVAKVSEMDQKVIGTFTAPVMIPGQVLPPGTYVFKVLDVWGSRDVIRVTTADESRVLATAFTIPRYRMNAGDKEIFQFEERGADSPQALKAWFYPGFSYGHEFVYPKTIAVATVSSGVMNAGPTPTAAPAEESAAVAPEQPTAEEPAPVVADNTPTQAQTPQTSTAPAEAELPKTASSTPLIGLVGMLLLGGAFGLRALAARRS